MPLDYPQRKQNLVYGGKSGFIGYLMIRPSGPWRMYWKTLEGLVLWLDFNKCQAIDLSGNGNNGTIYGAQCVEGRSGKALSFDGVDDYVEVNDSESLDITNGITILAWINANSFPKEACMINKDTSSSNGYGFFVKEGRLAFLFGPGGYSWDYKSDVAQPQTNKWEFVGVTYNGVDTINYYLNGEYMDSKHPSGSIAPNDKVLTIAKQAFTAKGWFDGIIDEVRIYNRPLSEEEIKWLYEHT